MAILSNSADAERILAALTEAFGLPPHMRSLEIRMAVDDVVTVKCEYFPVIGGVRQLQAIAGEFSLMKKE